MSVAYAAEPVIAVPSEERAAFLRRVALWTFAGLFVSAVVGVASTFFIAPFVYGVGGSLGGLLAILGTFAVAHWLCRGLVYGGAKVFGFLLAAAAEGISLGFLLLTTLLFAGDTVTAGLFLIGECLLLTATTAIGMLIYVWFRKSEFSLIGAGLSVFGIPMLCLMALTFVMPIGGTLGIVIAAAFVVFSAGALLYQLNHVVHNMDAGMHVEGAYELTMAILVLFWNLLVLLNRLRR